MKYKYDNGVKINWPEMPSIHNKCGRILEKKEGHYIVRVPGIHGNYIIPLNRLSPVHYVYKEFKIGNFRFSLFKLGKKKTVRLEYAKGWE